MLWLCSLIINLAVLTGVNMAEAPRAEAGPSPLDAASPPTAVAGDGSAATPVLALPDIAAPSDVKVLNVATGEKLALDHLGPIVVNEDGSMSRITNWESMSEREQSVTRKRIAQRNAQRLQALHGTTDTTIPYTMLPS